MSTPGVHLALLLGVLALVPAAWADLGAARGEPDLEKRSGLALDNADRALKSAREAYGNGDLKDTAVRIQEVEESVQLAEASLKQTGKDPRRSPKWFKRAEIRTNDLLRKLDAFNRQMSYADRDLLAKVTAKVRQVHEDLLVGIMEGKKRK